MFLLAACQKPAFDESDVNSPAVPSVTSIDAPEKILFIGNSFTYYNGGIDLHLAMLAASAEPPVVLEVSGQTTPSQTLKGHHQDKATARALARQSWDAVILQGASYEPVDEAARDEFFEFARRLTTRIRDVGAQPVFFMTWAWKFRPGMSGQLQRAYVKQGNETDAFVVPVGLAWEHAKRERPDISLYSDIRHSSMHGTYLATCVFYAALLGRSPVGLSYTAGLEKGEAVALQQIAWETTRSFYRW